MSHGTLTTLTSHHVSSAQCWFGYLASSCGSLPPWKCFISEAVQTGLYLGLGAMSQNWFVYTSIYSFFLSFPWRFLVVIDIFVVIILVILAISCSIFDLCIFLRHRTIAFAEFLFYTFLYRLGLLF